MEYNLAVQTAFLAEVISQADSGAGNAYLTIRSGSREAINATTFYNEQVLATFPLNKPCATYSPDTYGQQTVPRYVFDLTSPDAILERNGIASVWRLHDSDGTTIVMGDVSELAGTGEIRFSALEWEADGTSKITINFAAITMDV